MPERVLSPAVAAFDAVAERFDSRFGEWRSVAAQRGAVQRYLLDVFPAGARLLELAGGTAEDALFLAAHDRNVLLTDGAPAMVARARAKAEAAGLAHRIQTRALLLEDLETVAAAGTLPILDGAYSNFAGLNCVADLRPVARGLARLLPAGAAAVLVVFGPHAPGEMLVQLMRGDVRAAFRRLRAGPAPAHLGGHEFRVYYPSPAAVARAFAPWFRLERTRAVGVFVPPSAAEPFISRAPRLLHALAAVDRMAAAPLAAFGDHVLLHFVRTSTPPAETTA
jgi:SAM-dependent methyltransferase